MPYPNTLSHIHALLLHGTRLIGDIPDAVPGRPCAALVAATRLACLLAEPPGATRCIDDLLSRFLTTLHLLHRSTVNDPPRIAFRVLRGGGQLNPWVSQAVFQTVADVVLHACAYGSQEVQVSSLCAPPSKLISVRAQGHPWQDSDPTVMQEWLDPFGVTMHTLPSHGAVLGSRPLLLETEVLLVVPLPEVLVLAPAIGSR